mmetsp:Transcript_31745/g.57833  ORF Transcript_31745/g.57833 Transcript_31745/m.57833 type:complete len:231 (+) Transcript_31745:117-809(+)|eukprot:CAMPEP_0197648390 /NCGR_PEP_ID=MMETSP1338-20131121/27727_1 /TAXON_ID=43686 ORGANISM="Pelagodinium beii, Strain RCC1491" /NCGR_SAMPLE_ID=MMETSP1338 /ASSEMBLY_ACC=CAM_ASM_000754 /LENGTH=230 /DNA_ID=CAMNT_0043222377 /DNA_START=83 /DNA_END=775 /DNA_ORIENTATION=-
MCARWLLLLGLAPCAAVAKLGMYQLPDAEKDLLQPDVPRAREVELAQVADSTLKYVKVKLPGKNPAATMVVYVGIITMVLLLLCAVCASWITKHDPSGYVFGMLSSRQSTRQNGKDDLKRSGSTSTAFLPPFRPSPSKAKKFEQDQEEATLFRQWEDPRSLEDSQVHFLRAPTFDSPPGVLSSKEVKGTPTAVAWPRSERSPGVQVPQISPASQRNAYLVKKGVAQPTGA